MSKQILVNSRPYECRVATLEDGEIKQLHIERLEDRNVVGNIYKGLVKRVLPGMQAAFLELGLERTAFLYVDDIIDEPLGTEFDFGDDDGGDEDDSDDESLEARSDRNLDDDYDDELDDEEGEDFEPEGKSEDPEKKVPNGAPEDTDGDVPNGNPKSSDRDVPNGNPKNSDRDVPNGNHKNSDRDVPNGNHKNSDRDVPNGNHKNSDRDVPNGNHKNSDRDVPNGDHRNSDRDVPNGDHRNSDRDVPNGNHRNSDKDVPNGNHRNADREARGNQRNADREPNGNQRNADREGNTRDRDRNNRGRNNDRNRNRNPRNADRDGSGGNTRDGDREGSRGPRSERGRRSGRTVASSNNNQRGGRRGPSSPRGRGGRSGGRPGGGRKGGGRGRRERRNVDIQDLLKEGQEILVQVAKAPIGTKGARLTTHISLPGRNLVLMPTVKHLGISRRIESDRERRRLRDIFTKRIKNDGKVGFIIRTVAAGKSFRELKADADYLLNLWTKIQDATNKKRAPALIHEDLSLGLKTVRDSFNEEVDSFIIDNSIDHEKVVDFVTQFSPRLKARVKLFRGPSQLFEHYGIEAEISRALGKKVWLKSGGYLLIDQSEALTAIDVNTGRYVGSKSLEETILKTNLEAVKEIAYQLRMRNVGGIIIMDLIDMESTKNRRIVFDALQEALTEDKARTNILKISDLGLVEMTRKRTHEDLVRYLTESCHYCDGRGYHKSRRTVAYEIFREIEKEAIASTDASIVVFVNPLVAQTLNKEERTHVRFLEKNFNRKLLVKTDESFHVEQYEVFSKP